LKQRSKQIEITVGYCCSTVRRKHKRQAVLLFSV
jgi:hypothetical protein